MCLPGFFLCLGSLFCCLTGIAVLETAAMESAHRRDDIVLVKKVQKAPPRKKGTPPLEQEGAIIRDGDIIIVNQEAPGSELAADVVVVEKSPIVAIKDEA